MTRGWSSGAGEGIVRHIAPSAKWEQLNLPPAGMDLLHVIADGDERGDGRVIDGVSVQPGLTVLFAGPAGTGKTMASDVLAKHLSLDLYRINLSSVVSEYVGETEKNLRRVFDGVEVGRAVLLFDEADALFGKRTEVKGSHDWYANLEVSHLMERMEGFAGLSILTTDREDELDAAFKRRFDYIVPFPHRRGATRLAAPRWRWSRLRRRAR